MQLLTLDGAVVENDAENLTDMQEIKGDIGGNEYSIKGADQTYLIATSEFAIGGAGLDPDLLDGVEQELAPIWLQATRPITGEVTDIGLVNQVEVLPEAVQGIQATVELQPPVAPIIVVGFAMWDFQTGQWNTVDVAVVNEEDEPNAIGNIELELEVAGGPGYARRYINSTGMNIARIWTWGYGDVFGDNPDYTILWDLMNVEFFSPGNENPG